MVKILKDKYPFGTYKGQKTDGKFIDGYILRNLRMYAKKIVDDMTFMGVIFSSTLEVGTGKSVFATQLGEAWTELIKEEHGIDVPFTTNNIVWKPKDLIDRAFQLPKYSCILLDEWEDANYWSDLGMTLRQFFRKCRQLNLFMLVIIPNWFQFPMSYAISRSAFAIDVRFADNFERGFFSFYNFPAKRMLYVLGKRNQNYKVIRPSFYGRFIDGYGVDEEEYRRKKYEDMVSYDQEKTPRIDKVLHEIKTDFFKKINAFFEKKKIKLSKKDWARAFGVGERTIYNWFKGDLNYGQPTDPFSSEKLNGYKKILQKRGIDWTNEKELEERPKDDEKNEKGFKEDIKKEQEDNNEQEE